MLPTTKPLSVLLMLAYASGAPLFDSIRPAPLDLPLRGFHTEVTALAHDGFRTVRKVAADPIGHATDPIFGRLFAGIARDMGRAVDPR